MSFTRMENPKQSLKGCWTCKRRKIGCDKFLPKCQNCLRTNRECEGYGLKLQWPESGDGRRPAHDWESANGVVTVQQTNRVLGKVHFLNTTYHDIQGVRRKEELRSSSRLPMCSLRLRRRLSYGFEQNFTEYDGILLAYYHTTLSRMVTTVDDSLNGFRNILLPIALSEQTLCSQSLRQVILGLSAFHLWGHGAAAQYKLNAIRLLSSSIQSGEKNLPGQFATCMMLCVCDVFDSADGSWYTHLAAAETLAKQLPKQSDTGFFLSWLSYHSVLAKFSQSQKDCKLLINPRLPSHDIDRTFIIGSLGCSLQVLDCISCTNELSGLMGQSSTQNLPARYATYPMTLLKILQHLVQRPGIVEDSDSGKIDAERVCNTAELYRLAADIHLRRSVLQVCSDAVDLQLLVEASLQIIDELGTSTSPWPMFITACEVISDEQRIRVLIALNKMRKERRIGNVDIMTDIVERVWKSKDLGSWNGDWRELVEEGRPLPSFI